MNYWIIDVSAGCPWGYSFAVKAELDDDIDEWYYRDMVIKGARKAGLFNNENDWCGCGVHLFDYDALADLEDWKDDAVEIEI